MLTNVARLSPEFFVAARGHLAFLYGEAPADRLLAQLAETLVAFKRTGRGAGPSAAEWASQRDAVVIAYGDMVQAPGVTPLACLGEFLDAHVGQVVNGIHVLPFFPSSSDDGFSVVDYLRVDPALGSWDDIHRLAERRRLMIDAVLNHVSSQSEWFQAYLRGEPGHHDFFIEIAGEADLSHVVRPRTTPLGTVFAASGGDKQVWTTFSADQVDLNFGNPQVLLRAVGVVLEYVAHRASMIRLDAIAYLWKELGTACIHLAQTHQIVQLLRVVLDEVAPHVKLVTETNVPHAENVSYFGDGQNEAQWVYNFVLPPLVLHALWRGSSAALADWVSGLTLPSPRVTFFNFLACHDGIGLNPALGILPPSEIEALVERVLHRGGEVSAKRNPDGSESPYELNVNYFDALADSPSEALQIQVDRFMVAQSIMLALRGVPGIYFHSLFGSRGWPEGFRGSGMKRAINRQKLRRADLEAELAQDGTLRRQVLDRFLRLLRVRAACKGFHPYGSQEVAPAGEAVLALWRASPLGEEPVLCLHNLRSQAQTVVGVARGRAMHDLLSGEHMEDPRRIPLAPYQVRWLRTDEASHG